MKPLKTLATAYKILAVAFATLFYTSKAFLDAIRKKGENGFRKNAVTWSKALLNIFKIKVEVLGAEKLKKNETYVFVSNHASLFDIPILFYALKDFPFIIIYKRSLRKVPILGAALIISPFVPIDRQKPRKAMESVDKTINLMKEKDCPIVFPEGTRSKTGKLGPFKRGAFLIASRAKRPVVPIAVKGSSEILPRGSIAAKSGVKAKVVVGDPIPAPAEISRKTELDLMNKTKDAIEKNLLAS